MPELSLTPEQPPRDGLSEPQGASTGAGGAQDVRDAESGSQAPSGASSGSEGQRMRPALAANAVGTAVNASGAWLPLTARQAVADAVLAAIEPALEHCIHDRAVHDQHHTRPVDACPWCGRAGTGTETVQTPEGTL